MSITRTEFKYKKPNLRYDDEANVWIGYRIDVRAGRKRYRNTFRTKGEAERFINELRSQTVYGKAGLKFAGSDVHRVSKLLAARLAKITDHSEKTRAIRVFAYFEGLLDHDLPVTAVKTMHFRLFINARTEDGVKPETINREMNTLASAFHKAEEMFPRELEGYEAPKIARPTVKKGKRPKHEITEAEAQALIKTIGERQKDREYPQRVQSRPVIALMFELAWMLGLRIGETEKLLKTDYDRRKGSLRVVRWKTNDITTYDFLPERAVEIIKAAIGLSGSDVIFELACSRHTVEKIIAEACEANGLVYGRNKLDGITFHSTRHAFTSRLVRVTDMPTARSFTSHSSDEMVDYYSIASPESRRLAMEKLYGKVDEKKLREIFDKTRKGKLDFETFLEALKQGNVH